MLGNALLQKRMIEREHSTFWITQKREQALEAACACWESGNTYVWLTNIVSVRVLDWALVTLTSNAWPRVLSRPIIQGLVKTGKGDVFNKPHREEEILVLLPLRCPSSDS